MYLRLLWRHLIPGKKTSKLHFQIWIRATLYLYFCFLEMILSCCHYQFQCCLTALWFFQAFGQMWHNVWSLFYCTLRKTPFIKHAHGSFVIIFKINFNGVDILSINTKILSDIFPFVVDMFTKFFNAVVGKNSCLIEIKSV